MRTTDDIIRELRQLEDQVIDLALMLDLGETRRSVFVQQRALALMHGAPPHRAHPPARRETGTSILEGDAA